ncbi:MAG: hypothetical protein JWM57_3928 [Phycisphaerales bacterium]|nr:hypothetical protein [Phycisphaerales bacterium]
MSLFESFEGRRLFAAAAFGTFIKGFGTNGVGTAPTLGGSDNGHIEASPVSGGKTLVGVGGGLTRFNADGTVDTTFGTAGITLFKRVSFIDDAVDSSGNIYVLVTATAGTLVQRYSAAGRLDTSFATGGSALVESSATFTPVAIDVQNDGKIVVAGAVSPENNVSTTRVYRLTTGGAADGGFGTGGKLDLKLGVADLLLPNTFDTVADVHVLDSGKIEVIGASNNNDGSFTGGDGVVALARLTSGGALDSSFGTGGVARRAAFDDVFIDNASGVIRDDGSAVVSTNPISSNNDQRTNFVGFSTAGKVLFNAYAPSTSSTTLPIDAVALGDGRVAFTNADGHVWEVGTDGTIGSALQPLISGGANAITTSADGALLVADVSSPNVRLAKIAAGRLGEARPDNLPAATVIATAADAEGGFHIAFLDTASKTLKYAYRNSQGYWGGIRTVDSTVGAGAAISIDTIQAKGRTNVAIAYYDATNGDLKLAFSNTNGRRFGFEAVATKGNVGISPSLHYTDSGGFAVSYYSKTTQSLYYALNNGTGWATDLVATGGSGLWSEMQFDPSTRRPAIAYSGPKNTVMYALKDKTTGWNSITLATTKAGAAFVNLALPQYATAGPRVSYYDLAAADLVYANYYRYSTPRNQIQTVAARGNVGAYSDIFNADYSGSTIAYAWSRSADAVIAYTDVGIGLTPTATTVATGGGRNLSVAFSQTSYTVAGIAYTDTASGLTFVRG